jgi:hypothetical protein
VEERPVPRNRNILRDQLITFNGYSAHKHYPHSLRRTEVWDEEKKETIVLLTNHLTFGSTTLAVTTRFLFTMIPVIENAHCGSF